MKKVLIITYYWPPSGGAGVQRWLKFSKYLPSHGWQPVIYTPSNPEAPVDDPSLMKDIHPETMVVKRPIWEPYHFYKRFIGMAKGDRVNAGFLSEVEKPSKKEGLAVWIRGNLFIPDARRFWIRPSVRFLKKFLRENPVDAMISTGPPHSMHLIALAIKKETGIPWIADFRDPWTEIDFYDQLKLTRWADRKHNRQEQAVVKTADQVVVVTNTVAERYRTKTGIEPQVIYNGFDEADFQGQNSTEQGIKNGVAPDKFTLVHVGAMNRDRNHCVFWEVLGELIRERPGLTDLIRVKLVGKTDISVLQDTRRYGVEDIVEMIPYVPHQQIPALLRSATVLYLPINRTPYAKSIIPGKIFEYLAANRPVLGTGPGDGDSSRILKHCHAGVMIDYEDKKGLKTQLEKWLDMFDRGELLSFTPVNIGQFTRKNLSSRYAQLLNRVSQK